MKTRRAFILVTGCCVAAALTVVFFLPPSTPNFDLKKQTFLKINKIRESKKQEVVDYFKTIQEQAQAISKDQEMRRFFTLMKEGNGSPELELDIDKHYVTEYGNFYDILFIDSTGYIFHSVKKEPDYKQNIFRSGISDLQLAKHLKRPGDVGFVEYEYYPPSNEAAAFFSVALTENNRHAGWFVLQCALNNINTILTNRKGLGRTGETYLVNKKKLMLTDSRFMEDSTILRQRVDTEAIHESFLHGSGERIINDYRGVKVFSSFDKFDLLGATWIIIVEIDEDEVITDHFQEHKEYFTNEIISYLAKKKKENQFPKRKFTLSKNRVDINEFAKAEEDTYLTTAGVSTCTAVAITYPNKFGYLSHISPTDEIYLKDSLTKFFLQSNYHNFLSELLRRIQYYEIYPYEITKLQFVIVAPHTASFSKAVDTLLAQNIELSNIKFLYNPSSHSANVLVAPPDFSVHVRWNGKKQIIESAQKSDDLATIVKRIIRYDS